LQELPGRKILVLGNHDHKSPQYYMKHGFDFACYEFTWRNYLFTHHPIQDTRGKINIHGHFHTMPKNMEDYPWYDKKIHKLISMPDNNYQPIKLKL
jgi:calcineurin-like phosphoesterase family protein